MSVEGVKKTREYQKPRNRVMLEERDGVIGKLCTGDCGEWKCLTSYAVSKKGVGGRESRCKECRKKYRESNRERDKETYRRWYENNKERHYENNRKWALENSDKNNAHKQKWRDKNPLYADQYYTKNRENILIRQAKYRRENQELIKGRQKKYRLVNRERIKITMHKWYLDNKDYCKNYSTAYYKLNKDRYIYRTKWWRKRNPERYKLHVHRRRAQIKKLPKTLTIEQKTRTWMYFGNACALTGSNEKIEIEHAIPLSIGHGGTTFENCYPMANGLNQSKGNRNIFEWFEANRQRFELSQERFDNLIAWLASANAMTVEEYRDHVYWCHANPRDINELEAK